VSKSKKKKRRKLKNTYKQNTKQGCLYSNKNNVNNNKNTNNFSMCFSYKSWTPIETRVFSFCVYGEAFRSTDPPLRQSYHLFVSFSSLRQSWSETSPRAEPIYVVKKGKERKKKLE
jgi:hypothetical protein